MIYKSAQGGVVRLMDNAFIPGDMANRDWREYQDWLAAGNRPAPAHSVTEAKVTKWEAIKAERDRLTEFGGYKVGGKWFHSDQKSRSQQLGLVLLDSNIPAGLQWKTMDGSFVTMTAILAQQILGAGAASDQANFATAETHRAAMETSVDPAGYDFSGEWPKVFGE